MKNSIVDSFRLNNANHGEDNIGNYLRSKKIHEISKTSTSHRVASACYAVPIWLEGYSIPFLIGVKGYPIQSWLGGSPPVLAGHTPTCSSLEVPYPVLVAIMSWPRDTPMSGTRVPPERPWDKWKNVLWDGDGLPPVDRQIAVKTVASTFLRNAGNKSR